MTTTGTEENEGGGNLTLGTGGGARPSVQVTPFSTAAKGAAMCRMRGAQAAMGKTLTLAQAVEKGREEERKKKREEEAARAAAAATAKAKEKEDRMDMDDEEEEVLEIEDEDDDEEEDGSLGEVARNLAKENATSSGKKRRSGELAKSSGTSTVVARKTYAAAATALRPSSYVPHEYNHPRVIIEGSARLEADDKVKEFLDLVVTLISNGKIVDNFFAIVPVIMGSGKKDLRSSTDVPTNMTTLGGYIKISEKSLKVFEKKNASRASKGKKGSGGATAYNNDVVYFTFAIACNVEPSEILPGIMVEWMRKGGIGLYRKEIQAFNTFSPFVIFYLYTNISVHTIMAEFKKMMEEAITLVEEDAMVDDQERITALPPFAFRKSLPKLPGMDPEEYSGLKPKQAATRRAWHIEMETQHVKTFFRLIERCKEVLMFQTYWGEHVLISEVVEYDSPPVWGTAKKHTCFHVSMTGVQLYGIMDLDAPVP